MLYISHRTTFAANMIADCESGMTPSTLGDSVSSAMSQLKPARPLNWHGIDLACALQLVMASILDGAGGREDGRAGWSRREPGDI